MTMQEIKAVARHVRKACSHHLCSDDLAGYCGLCSDVLQRVINHIDRSRKAHYRSGYFYRRRCSHNNTFGSDHAWVSYEGHIIDITATQFVGVKTQVLVTTRDDPRYVEHNLFSPLNKKGTVSSKLARMIQKEIQL